MNKKSLAGLLMVALSIGLLPVTPAQGQPTSPFFQAVTNLNPSAYWPLQETTAPPIADVEVNLGSLGAVANAYYSSTNLVKGMPGPGVLTDKAVSFRTNASNGSFLAVPLTDHRVALSAGAPFSVEAWVYPTNALVAAVLSQTGPTAAPGLNNGPNAAGWTLNQGYMPAETSGQLLGWSFHVFNGVGGTGGAEVAVPLSTLAINTWYHLVGVFDGTNATLYVNGDSTTHPAAYQIPMTGAFVADTWDPLTVGCGRGLGSNPFGGTIDEVAIYPTNLTAVQVANHYSQAISGSDAGYVSAIEGDGALIYYRMDASGYTPPAVSAYPPAASYGLVNAGGLYLSGSTPGLTGPAYAGLGSPSYACGFNGIGTSATNGIPLFVNGTVSSTNAAVSGVMITNLDSSLNLKSNSISALVWFKSNPMDNRFQNLIGHSDSSWRLAMDGTTGKPHWNPGEGGELTSAHQFNDGNWHLAVGVYTNSGMGVSP